MSFFDTLFRILFGRRTTTRTSPPPPPVSPPPSPRPAPPPPPVSTSPPPPPPVSPPPVSPPPPPPPTTGGAQPGPNYLASLVAQDRTPLRRADFERVAAEFNCEWEALAAVAEVESGRLGGFAADGRPIILYERHLFSRKTDSQFDASHPNVSNRSAGGYPPSQAERWAQMAEAYALAPDAALESASYGRFQVLGQNYRNGGYANVHDFVSDMARSEQGQLKSFTDFIRANGLIDELQTLNWAGFARRYNGPSYEQYQYDTKMANAYQKMKTTPIA